MSALSSLRRKFGALMLRTQLLLTFLLSSLLILGLGSVFLYVNLLEILQHRNEESTVRSFRQVERNLLDFQTKTDSLSKSYFLNSDFETFLNDTEKNEYRRIQLVRSIMQTMAADVRNYPFLHSIFIITKDGKTIGVTSSTSYASLQPTPRPFQQSPMNLEAVERYPRLVWAGGGRSGPFETSVAERKQPGADVPIISAARAVKTFYQSVPGGTLVFNLLESSVYDTFGDLTDDPDTRMVLLDANGTIISSNDKAGLGQRRSDLDQMTGQYGSFITNMDDQKRQFIYYRLSETGWLLGMEMPLSVFMSDIYTLRWTLMVVLLISLIIGGAFSFWWTRKLTGPIYTLLAGMRNLKQGHLGTQIAHRPSNELGIVVEEFNRMSHSISELVEENNRIERGKKLAEIKVLQSQINPHFLFNTLNTIKWMAISIRATNIMETITSLGNLIRPIYKSTVPIVPLREELDYVQDYLKIMNTRYGDGIHLIVNIEEALLDITVPRLIVQPLIENALLHGLEPTRFRGEIRIEGARTDGDMLLHVRDNGCGIPEDKLTALRLKLEDPEERDNVGLSNVHQRLQLHYGLRYGIEIQSGQAGTCVTLRLPAVPKS
ncbi:cache domain-containing sensor histidine kinase [Cohnella silvisoli]|uniref:histidine kinase n=1 Tax=Cohnella silvisoli TaxID=2873699 RepID=A0ABV1KRS0_9BACL|nr:sensor histidine kinase [Cohnella silvisoli]MCD9021732.1 sensor histidine kinase [Cohnella silvisoli]